MFSSSISLPLLGLLLETFTAFVTISCWMNLDGKQAFPDLTKSEWTAGAWIFAFQKVLAKDRAVGKDKDSLNKAVV